MRNGSETFDPPCICCLCMYYVLCIYLPPHILIPYLHYSTTFISTNSSNTRHAFLDIMNVYMFGFDSISRLSAIRWLPKTYKYWTETLGAVVLEGYNIVGDGTPQALLPILTGRTEQELPLTRKRFQGASHVDIYPWIWSKYELKGYVTMFSEDAPYMGTFSLRLKGFNHQPTDHYMRTFYLMMEGREGWAPQVSSTCHWNKPSHAVFFKYAQDFFKAYPNTPKFAFSFHTGLTHNDPSKLAQTDEEMLAHLKFFHSNHLLKNSVLLFMADHGPRFGAFRNTYKGKWRNACLGFPFSSPNGFRVNSKRDTRIFCTIPKV